MHYLDVMRKIWSFIYDLLEERQYIREDLTLAASPEDAAVLRNLSLLGDSLLSERWANLAVFVLFKYFQEFSHLQSAKKEEELVEVVLVDESAVSNKNKNSRFVAMHATLRSVLQCIRIYAEYAKVHTTLAVGGVEEGVNTQDLFSAKSHDWENSVVEKRDDEKKKNSLNFYQSVKDSLAGLLSNIDAAFAEDEVFTDVVEEVRAVLQLL